MHVEYMGRWVEIVRLGGVMVERGGLVGVED